MSTIPIKHPRRIDPSLVEIGDDISVEHKPDRGVTTILRGIVGKRVDNGQTRYLMTVEGATLIAWEPNRLNGYKVTLFGRDEPVQETLFDVRQMVEQRIA